MTITINSRTYTVRTHSVGLHHATEATVRIGGRVFRSELRPYGFIGAALEDISYAVRAVYPDAVVTE
jgi:hypothetical protein